MKKQYMKPTMSVVKIQQTQILCGSPYDDIKSPVETYDDPEDVITDKGSIW